MTAPLQDMLSGRNENPAYARKWQLYAFEAIELAIFMFSACVFTFLLFDPACPANHLFSSDVPRRLLMGIAMGLTAILLIHSPMGKRSGAHFNPAITLTYFRLGKIAAADAGYYIAFQFGGGILGVGISAILLGSRISDPTVKYAITVPGPYGPAAAFLAEFGMAFVLMEAVLWASNRPPLANYTSYLVGMLITLYILFFAPVSGFSINPARTTGSAAFAHIWTGWWIYFTAPVFGMLGAAEIYLRAFGADRILCAHLHPSPNDTCPFLCHHPLHRHGHVVADRTTFSG